MKLTLLQLINGYGTMVEIVNVKEKLPTKLSYAVARNVVMCEKEYKLFEERKLEIFKELGELIPAKDGQPEQYKSLPETRAEIDKRINDHLTSELDVPLHQVKLKDAGDTFLPSQMINLEWMFIEE